MTGVKMAIDENKQKALAAAWARLRNNLVKAPSCAWVKTVHGCGNHLYRFAFTGYRAWGSGLPMGRIVEIYGPESSGKTR